MPNPRKPIELKQLTGTFRPDREPDGVEMPRTEGAPTPPEELSEGARAEWFRIVDQLQTIDGLLCTLDKTVIGLYCSCYDQWQQAEKRIPELESVMDSAIEAEDLKATMAALSYWTKQRTRARQEMRNYIIELGLSPKSRAAIRLPEPKDKPKEESPFERAARLASQP